MVPGGGAPNFLCPAEAEPILWTVMEEWLLDVERSLEEAPDLDSRLDVMQRACYQFGFTGINYDYSPVPRSSDGSVITPVLLKLRGIPGSMYDLWCHKGYYQIDPVVLVSNSRAVPFSWSYLEKSESVIAPMMHDRAAHRRGSPRAPAR